MVIGEPPTKHEADSPPVVAASARPEVHEIEPSRPSAAYGRRRVLLTLSNPRQGMALPVVMVIAFLGVVLLSGTRGLTNLDMYPTLAIGPVFFVAVQLISPRTRFRMDVPLCPANWAWLLFTIVLVLQPALVIIFGPAPGELYSFPGPGAVQEAFVLSVSGLPGVCGRAHHCASTTAYRPFDRNHDGRRFARRDCRVRARWRGRHGVAVHVTRRAVLYFSGAYTSQVSANASSASLASVASTFLRPLGAYGLILFWARTAESTRIHRIRLVVCGAGALVILATYDYNRASVVIPLVALVAAYGRHIGNFASAAS